MILYGYGVVPDEGTTEIDSAEGVPRAEGVRGIDGAGWRMFVSPVPAGEYSQESIDRHADDLEWIGAIGLGHQRINDALANRGDVIPLRAFTLFSDESAVQSWLEEQNDALTRVREHIAGKLEWTVKLEIGGTAWMKDPDIEALEREISSAPAGRAFLLKKKLERELERSRGEMETELVREVAAKIEKESGAESVVETRAGRSGANPQIDLLYDRERTDELEQLLERLELELKEKEISIAVTGPWPPYSFTEALAGTR